MTDLTDPCLTHCCPIHGCKYGRGGEFRLFESCVVAGGTVEPVYPKNNGCEICEFAHTSVDSDSEPCKDVAMNYDETTEEQPWLVYVLSRTNAFGWVEPVKQPRIYGMTVAAERTARELELGDGVHQLAVLCPEDNELWPITVTVSIMYNVRASE